MDDAPGRSLHEDLPRSVQTSPDISRALGEGGPRSGDLAAAVGGLPARWRDPLLRHSYPAIRHEHTVRHREGHWTDHHEPCALNGGCQDNNCVGAREVGAVCG